MSKIKIFQSLNKGKIMFKVVWLKMQKIIKCFTTWFLSKGGENQNYVETCRIVA